MPSAWKSLLDKFLFFSSTSPSSSSAEMSSTIHQVFHCALRTFAPAKDPIEFQRLVKLVKTLRAEDLNFHQTFYETFYETTRVTGGYVDLVHTDQLSMGVFSVKPNGIIPLHDHQSMHGLIKVLSGALEVQSYTPIAHRFSSPFSSCSSSLTTSLKPSDSVLQKLPHGHNASKLVCVLVHEPRVLTPNADSEVAILTPNERNLHQIRSIDLGNSATNSSRGAAFLDILSPPYHSERDCHYFRLLETQFDDRLDSDVAWLLPLDQAPADFSTISLPYQGPTLL